MKRSLHTALWLGGIAAAGALLLHQGSALAGGPRGNSRVPEPSKPVDLDRYAGRWYEFARYDNRFERGCEAVIAEYTPRADGVIAVRNSCRMGRTDGPVRVSNGRAKVVADSDNAKLKVSFFGPFYIGKYWILDHADDYSWSIVGEPSGRFLWILTRSRHPEQQETRTLIERARVLGYDTSLLRRTAQPNDDTGAQSAS